MTIRFLLLGFSLVLLFFLNIVMGSVNIPVNDIVAIFKGDAADSPAAFIVLESRLPQAVTALLSGAALTVTGLLLQTAFRNPLAGPSVLGVTSGASLGVALVMLFFGGSVSVGNLSFGGQGAVLAGALAGSFAIMALLLVFASCLRNELMLLIAGIMTGYLTSSIITLLTYSSTAQGVYGFTMWGLGNFSSVTLSQLPVFTAVCVVGLVCSALMIKPLNVIRLGEDYARNLGISVNSMRNLLLAVTGVLTAVVTAYCGPVSFIGLAVPHIARFIFRTSNQRVLIPGCMLTGAAIGLLCNFMCTLPDDIVLPLNAVTPLVGVPVILYVMLKERRRR